jgi:hypothetical protein
MIQPDAPVTPDVNGWDISIADPFSEGMTMPMGGGIIAS